MGFSQHVISPVVSQLPQWLTTVAGPSDSYWTDIGLKFVKRPCTQVLLAGGPICGSVRTFVVMSNNWFRSWFLCISMRASEGAENVNVVQNVCQSHWSLCVHVCVSDALMSSVWTLAWDSERRTKRPNKLSGRSSEPTIRSPQRRK